jgi:dinuclear metal center YbgI/SA1388 family protein
MQEVKEVVSYCDQLLQAKTIKDYAPNGLQVEGAAHVDGIYTAVSASRDVLEKVVAAGGKLLIVHHGYFWKGEDRVLTGWMRERIRLCLAHDLNLVAYHLPLDYHKELGNNAQLGALMGWQEEGRIASHAGLDLVMTGSVPGGITAAALAKQLEEKLSHKPCVIENNPQRTIKKIAWCTGAAYDDIQFAIEAGADAFVTGEIAERTVHIAREAAIAFFAAGHHATERLGVQALGQHLAKKFALPHTFVDSDCPV